MPCIKEAPMSDLSTTRHSAWVNLTTNSLGGEKTIKMTTHDCDQRLHPAPTAKSCLGTDSLMGNDILDIGSAVLQAMLTFYPSTWWLTGQLFTE